ncbi:methylated-DNA--[protein]-cysteine S-methyltransferase [Alteromonas flava]|uniref:methylated-DNA--[protein]-cysteine S-methyltransferase n=1 Tax=Alteromonas flava TaxID=2048003 RepID=UPI0023E83AFA|nr:methylated-DNA--[protein]-cysteine S-methyltransferase [Alteromonas flava]
MLAHDYLTTPIGTLEICANTAAITSVLFVESTRTAHPNSITALGINQLKEYFAAQRQHFQLPLAPTGTQFQHKVWRALQQIPYGESVSYSNIALAIGNPQACRAVGAANGKNPISIIVPCHRVIGQNKRLVGYAGGLERKAWLLQLEAQQMNQLIT